MELARLFVNVSRFALLCVKYVLVEHSSKSTVNLSSVAAASGHRVFIGGSQGVTEWDAQSGAIFKLVEYTGLSFFCVVQQNILLIL